MKKSIFRKTFGNSPSIKLIDFFLGSPEFDFSLKEISRETGISWITLNRLIPDFVGMGMLKETRQVGKAKMYILNKSDEVVMELINVEKVLVRKFCENEQISVEA